MNNDQISKKNKRLALILVGIVLIAVLGALLWFSIYAPLVLY